MSDKTWKAFERQVARLLGSRRNPLSGSSNAGRSGDVIDEELEVECKLRENIAVFRWWEKLEQEAKASGKIPVLFMREKGNRRRVLACVDAKLLASLLGRGKHDDRNSN